MTPLPPPPTPHQAPPPPPGPAQPPHRDLGRLRRPTDDRVVAGVCSGLARHFDVDPVILRVAFVVLALFGGSGLLAYAAIWLLVPEAGSDDAPLGLDERNRGIALVGVAVLAVLALLGDWSGAFWFPWPVVAVVVVVLLLVSRSRQDDRTPAHPGEPSPYPVQPPARRPRKRGPILFGPTLALIALAIGLLLSADVAGLDVPDSAYPALVLAVTGGMLVVGAFWGRAGGLILVGLVALVVTLATSVAGQWDGEGVLERPTTAEAVADRYQLDAGKLTLDLTAVEDLEELDGRVIDVSAEVGELEVVVPEGLGARVTAVVHGAGSVRLFDEYADAGPPDRFDGFRGQRGGVDLRVTGSSGTGADNPTIDLDLDLDLGSIVVRHP